MNFLVPLYLAGALAVAIPIYLHLRRRPPKDSVEFGSLMFLRPTPHPPVKRSRQLENLPLLLLRCLALLLLAGLFARPFLRGGEEELGKGATRTVLLLDTSASMRRDGVWQAALDEASGVIAGLDDADSLAVMAVADAPRMLVDFEDGAGAEAGRRRAIAASALEAVEPGWGGSNLGIGLLAAAEALGDAAVGEESSGTSRVVLVSDLQGGAALGSVAGASWPPGVEVELRAVEAREATNATVTVSPSVDPERPAVRVWNSEDSERESFTLRVGDRVLPAVVPAGESRVFALPGPVPEVSLVGDAHEFDNTLHLSPREPERVTLHFLGEGEPDDSGGLEYYFRRAFGGSDLLEPVFVDDLDEPASVLAVARPLDQAETRAVRAALDKGARVLVVVSSTGMAETLGDLAGTGEVPVVEESGGRYALLEGIDFDDPLLAGFRDPRWRDFTGVHFWRHRVIEAGDFDGARVLARFDNGDPAWLEVPVGRGGLFVMSAGWHPRDSQLALSSKFVPLLYSLFADRVARVGEARQFFVGDALPLEEGDRRVVLPSGERRRAADAPAVRADAPGIYEVEGEFRTRRYAVNLRRSESELKPLEATALESLGVPLAGGGSDPVDGAGTGKRSLRDREAESNQNLWRWAALGLLVLLIVESWTASRSGGSQAIPEGAPS